MKITAEDEWKIVTIEIKNPSGHISEHVTLARGIAFAMEFHPDSVRAHLPTEEELDELITDMIDEA